MTLEDYLKQRYTPVTVANYLSTIHTYRQHNKKAAKALYADVVAYMGLLRTRYSKGATLNRQLMGIKAYYSWLCATGQRADNPAKRVFLRDPQRKDIQLQDLLSEAELEQLVRSSSGHYTLVYRNKVLMGLMVYQALQLCEILQVQTGDIDFDNGTLYVRPTLRTEARTLSLKPAQVMLIHEYIHIVRPLMLRDAAQATDILILSERGNPMSNDDISKHVKRNFKGWYGSRPVTSKSIRQSVIVNLLKKGTDVRIVQVFAGHKSTGTTGRYRQTEVDALKAAVVKYHPFA